MDMKKVVLEGCNSDWARRSYLPVLLQEAIENRIELIAVDKIPESSITPVDNWQSAIKQNKVRYINKELFKAEYSAIENVRYVFIVTPDRTHCEIADFWLSRLATGGQIFIEKPLDASLEAAAALHMKKGTKDSVYAFDHYLARATPFLNKKNEYLREIGDIKKVECRVMETDCIKPERIKTLENGIILDLLPHVLSVVVPAVTSLTSKSIKNIIPISSGFASYTGSPISEETFAFINIRINSIPVSTYVGYCVNARKNKWLTINGTKGKIELDLSNDRFITPEDKKGKWKKLQKSYMEPFLKSILQGDIPPSPEIGVMDFDTGLEILKFIEARRKENTSKMPEYPCHTSVDRIKRIINQSSS